MIFFFNDTATTEIYTLSLHDALPISKQLTPRKGLNDLESSKLITRGLGKIAAAITGLNFLPIQCVRTANENSISGFEKTR